MGIRGLTYGISPVIKSFSFDEFNGKIVLIDGFYIIHKYFRTCRKKYADKDLNIETIKMILNFIEICIIKNIKPVFIFDGKAPAEKIKEVEKRRLNQEKIKIKIEETIDENEKKRLKNALNPHPSLLYNVMKFFQNSNLPYYKAFGEADKLCASLLSKDREKIIGVFSGDTDFLVYGFKYLFVDLSFRDKMFIGYALDEVQTLLNFKNVNLFIDFCIFLGSDYNRGVKKGFDYLTKIFRDNSDITEIEKILNISDHGEFSFVKRIFSTEKEIDKLTKRSYKKNETMNIDIQPYKDKLEKLNSYHILDDSSHFSL